MEDTSELQLFTQVQSGNSDCFEYLFFKYYSELCRYVCYLLKSKSEAEEIVQETFIKLWERRSEIHIETSVKSYLYKSVHNQCLNYIERCRVRNNYSNRYIIENSDLLSPLSPDYPIANLLSQELEEILQKAIAELPDQCREIFLKIRHEEHSYSETAEILGISVNTVKTQLQRAMSKLREALKEYFPPVGK
jgi:RNA polymerase sigma-70 factor, ECF subfamily